MEAEVCELRIIGIDCCGVNDICVFEDFVFKFFLSVVIFFFVFSV